MKYIKVKSTNIIHYSGNNQSELLSMSKTHKDIDGTTYPENDWEIGEATDIELAALLVQQSERLSPLNLKRQADYPPIADQLDDIYHNGLDAWKATIKVTKDKYPK